MENGTLRDCGMSTALEELVGAMSVGELAKFAGSSVAEVVAKVLGSSSVAKPLRDVVEAKPVSATATQRVPRKLPKGALSSTAVLEVLRATKAPVPAQDVRAKVGGTPNQVRAVLSKLIEAGKVKAVGERRGTKYLAK
jgi:DNA-binding transcriptional ArsR family regulator